MPMNRYLLAIIGRRWPALYDLIPRGPQRGFAPDLTAEAQLNPQPLPPYVLGAALAAEFIHAAYFADRFGLDQRLVFSDLDDWCPTPPKLPKLPPWWPPRPWPDPEPRPGWFSEFHVGFAARLAAVSVEFEGAGFSELLNKALVRSEQLIKSSQIG